MAAAQPWADPASEPIPTTATVGVRSTLLPWPDRVLFSDLHAGVRLAGRPDGRLWFSMSVEATHVFHQTQDGREHHGLRGGVDLWVITRTPRQPRSLHSLVLRWRQAPGPQWRSSWIRLSTGESAWRRVMLGYRGVIATPKVDLSLQAMLGNADAFASIVALIPIGDRVAVGGGLSTSLPLTTVLITARVRPVPFLELGISGATPVFPALPGRFSPYPMAELRVVGPQAQVNPREDSP